MKFQEHKFSIRRRFLLLKDNQAIMQAKGDGDSFKGSGTLSIRAVKGYPGTWVSAGPSDIGGYESTFLKFVHE